MPSPPRRLRPHPLPVGASGIVAVSGGADSIALLHLLHGLGYTPIAAHLNHGLRGAESDLDEAFVASVASSLPGVEYRSIRIDVAALAAGRNLEATARHCRYDWLERLADEEGVAWIATGHHADDQTETVLHNLHRGSSLGGLRGIAAVRVLTDRVTLYRPMLDIRRAEIVEWLTARGLTWRTDSSNADTALTRNRLRHDILPWIADRLPRLADNLNRLADDAREYTEAIESIARTALAEAIARADGLVRLDAVRLEREPGLIVREVGRLLWIGEGWSRGEMNRHHWATFERAVRGEVRAAQFPGNLRAKRTRATVAVGKWEEGDRE